MGYRSSVAIAIAGTLAQINTFVKNVEQANIPDEYGLLPYFKIIEIKSDITIFAVYFESIKWYEPAEITWNLLRKIVEESGLAFVFYRIGEDYDDVETESYIDEESDTRYYLTDMFSIDRSIRFNYPELNILN